MTLFMLANAVIASVLPYVFYTLSLNYMEAGKASILAAGYGVRIFIFCRETDGACSYGIGAYNGGIGCVQQPGVRKGIEKI